MTLPKITNQQQAVLRLIYRHRFLDRSQIQVLMHHKDKRRIIAWLKDLREKQYIVWIYDGKDFINRSRPAIYYLGINSIRHLRESGEYPNIELRKRYKESSRSLSYPDKCILIADCFIDLEVSSKSWVKYVYQLEADYLNLDSSDSRYYALRELRPDIYYEKSEKKRKATYLIYIFDATLPRYMIKKRLKELVEYLYEEDWRDDLQTTSLAVHVACASIKELAYAKRFTRALLEDIDQDGDAHIRFATVDLLKISGITSAIWGEV